MYVFNYLCFFLFFRVAPGFVSDNENNRQKPGSLVVSLFNHKLNRTVNLVTINNKIYYNVIRLAQFAASQLYFSLFHSQ